VLSSRIRLARNISGYVFYARADKQQQSELLDYIRERIWSTSLKDDLNFLAMRDTSALERHVLSERNLISRRLAEAEGDCGVAISHNESLAVMVNEEDHLRIQTLASGLQLQESYEQMKRVEELLEEKIESAFSQEYGYLTACPTNVGTGLRVSVMLHLPGLKMTGQIEKVFRAAKDMHLALRGLHGEGSDPIGDFYQMSNQTTLGKSETDIIDDLVSQAVEPVVQYERKARQKLLEERKTALDDKIYRALGTLANTRMINSEEMLYLLSYLRLGIHLERVKEVSLRTVNEIFMLTQPGHLQYVSQKELSPAERDTVRADFIRARL